MVKPVLLTVLIAAIAAASPACADGTSSKLGLNWNAGANTIVIIPDVAADDEAEPAPDAPRRPRAHRLGLGDDLQYRCFDNGVCVGG